MLDHNRLGVPNEEGYFGIFAKLRRVDMFDRPTDSIYESDLVDFYDHVIGSDLVDVGVLERLIGTDRSLRVLELACGSGRISIPFAEVGHVVDGLEISADMLKLAERKRASLPADVAARLQFSQGDMTAFALGRRYDAIVLGATSISLLLDASQRRALFDCVKCHLAPDGQFIFDLVDLRGDRWRKVHDFLDVWTHETEEGAEFGIVGQTFIPGTQKYTFNVYRELITWSGETRRAIGTSTKVRLDPTELRRELTEAGFEVASELVQTDTITLVVRHARTVD